MKSDLRNRLAEKMAGEITLSDSPGKALKKWRMSFNIPQAVLSEHLDVSPSVISDYESGRRKSPGTAVVGKIVDTILSIDEASGGKYIKKFAKILYSDVDDDVIYDIHDYPSPVPLARFAELIQCQTVCGSLSQSIYGYTVVNSLNAITQLSSNEFNRIYGWSTERALIFTDVTSGKSPMVAIRVTPFKPRVVVLQGIEPALVHPLVPKMAEKDRITVLCTEMDVDRVVHILRDEQW
ncbi:MAG: helix-turn-helix protein [Methanoregulaceae archaeon PtaB.Bin009]|nr:MAG: helix-turn-helix protein [Methanoregulaceae archaeon PtaB.Bin009]OPY41778.1 MAG: helix-turn-helix protein [Methanoregulaceae archaeon PtaU1.Bin066]HNQ30098.1 helix-turn-helix domain-containing protein [Methanolinea sp.]HNS83270.1 helix-turn-helix domain-containing protein [Methanolinea sp.]